ncbi:MAG: phosphodiester glycosidase family protein [Bacteroidales bacterium]|nr:phosphodiester glycosidase family protein [Bacteroidales bacterium]
MKRLWITPLFVAVWAAFVSCNPYKIQIPRHEYGEGGNDDGETTENPVQYPEAGVAKEKTLRTTGLFRETQIKDGITLYSFEGQKEDITGTYQTVFVLEVDLNNEAYKVNFLMTRSDSVSAIGKRYKAIAAVNACYEQDAIYCRTNGYNHCEVSLDPDHLRFWKHEAAIVGDGVRKVGLVYGAKGARNIREGGIQAINIYKGLKEKNIFASAPMLIDDYDPVGARFVPEFYTQADFNKLDGEDYRRHQGVRHPRVAVALTGDNDLLFVVVDGRFPGNAEGMSARELTHFLVKHFNPRWAINMDGGGSSTMYVQGYGDPLNNVLNHPYDNKRWDHFGQRLRPTVFLVQYNE